jgi:ABC-type sugar transport system permease subunit
VGLPTSTFLNSSTTALPTVAAVGAWKGLGFYIIILTAGLLNIPGEMKDAALVDGAGPWQRFWRVTLPLLGHTLALVMVLLVIGAIQEFTLPFILTGGGPDNATILLNLLIYNEAFQSLHFGIASAAALLEFAFILVVSIVQLKLVRPTWSY